MSRYLLGGLTFWAVALLAAAARAQFPTAPARLEYERRPGAGACPAEEDFRSEVAIVRHGREGDFLPPDPYDDQTVVVRVTLERTGGRYRGTLTHVPPNGATAKTPTVAVNSECSDLVRDLAFSASFFLPLLKKKAPAAACPACPVCPTCAPAPVPMAGPALQGAEPSPFAPPRCEPDKDGDAGNDEACKELLARLKSKYGPPVDPAFWLSTGGLLTLAYTSDVGPGFSLGADVRGKYWSVGVEAQVTLPAPVRLGSDRDFDVSSLIGMLVPCARWTGERVHLFGCAAVGAGGLLTYDSQAPGLKSTVDWTVRIGPRAGVEIPLVDRFAAYVYGEVSFAPIYAVQGYKSGEPWVQSAASGFLGAGFSVKLTD